MLVYHEYYEYYDLRAFYIRISFIVAYIFILSPAPFVRYVSSMVSIEDF